MNLYQKRFEIRFTKNKDELIESQRLRHKIFIDEVGSSEKKKVVSKIETDKFDDYYKHLVIIDHEDMFLFDYPQLFIIDDAFKLMVKNSIDCIKFSKSTNCLASKDPECDDLMHISLNSDWIFSVQPSIWKISSYIKILEHYPQVNIWQLETLAQDIVKEYKLDICYLSGIGQKRGLYHYDSSIYPYIATALFKGKWVVNEYPNELQEIFVRYNINPYIRGFA